MNIDLKVVPGTIVKDHHLPKVIVDFEYDNRGLLFVIIQNIEIFISISSINKI